MVRMYFRMLATCKSKTLADKWGYTPAEGTLSKAQGCAHVYRRTSRHTALWAKLVWISKQTPWEDNERAARCLPSQLCCYPTGLSCCVCSCANVFKGVRACVAWLKHPLLNILSLTCAAARPCGACVCVYVCTCVLMPDHKQQRRVTTMWLTALITANTSYVRHQSSQIYTHTHTHTHTHIRAHW